MDKVFQKFLRSGIDLSPVGVERREDNNPYFCTPKGASIFGWAGVDGIHFCFVRDFGGMVFSVSPMNSAPDFVHPLANDFEDFLRLLLACSDSAALEQAWMWDKAQFEAFLQDNPPTQDQQRTLSELAEKMTLENYCKYLGLTYTDEDLETFKLTSENAKDISADTKDVTLKNEFAQYLSAKAQAEQEALNGESETTEGADTEENNDEQTADAE